MDVRFISQDRRRILGLSIAMMGLLALGGIAVTIGMLYRTAFDREIGQLSNMAASRAVLIAALARDADRDHPGQSLEATLALIVDAGPAFERFGETGELCLGRREGDRIAFLLARHPGGSPARADPVAWDSRLAEPMRRALRGESGTMVGPDYRGVTVIAAYQPLPELAWGVVVKLDRAELRNPFQKAGIVALSIVAVLLAASAAFVQRLERPFFRDIERQTSDRLKEQIAEREHAAEMSRDAESRTRAILDTEVDAILTIDSGGVIESVNRATCRMFGYDEAELVGRNVSVLMPEPYSQQHDGYLGTYQRTRQAKIIGIGREVPCRRQDGSVFPGDLSVSEVQLEGRVVFTGIMRDLSERQRREAALKKAEQRAVAAEELASVGALVAGLAHEIGTPMGVIQGHARLLEKAVEGDQARWRLQTIQEQIGRISRIIQSLLNMARPKATERIPVPLEPLLETTLSFLSENFARRDVRLVRVFEATASVTGDPERLQQLLLNLFLNAVDAMPEGGELRVGLHPDGRAGAILTIGDTGIGIAPENQKRIFEAFYTSKEAGKGNGLGLMVARRIVSDHGGSIEVESTVGVGTTFRIHFPWTPAYPAGSTRRPEPPRE